MKKSLAHLMYALCVCSLCFVAGCNSTPPIVLAFPAGTAPMLDAGQSQNFTINLMHDTKNLGVTWTLASVGTLTNVTKTSVTYNAPAGPLTAPAMDHLTATSMADKTKSATVTITIAPSAGPAEVDPNSPQARGAGKLAPPPPTIPAPSSQTSPRVTGSEMHRAGARKL